MENTMITSKTDTPNRMEMAAHPDIETGIPRTSIDYYLTYPHDGINDRTGLIVTICGFGDNANTEYQSKKLRPYLAEKYQCVVAGINYHGIGVKRTNTIAIPPLTVHSLETKYGIPQSDYHENGVIRLERLAQALQQRGVKELGYPDRLLYVTFRNRFQEYQSFGFLPAVDILQVVGKVLKAEPRLNRKKIILFGSSYGGYIALLTGKFAPNTFSAVVDNSGYVGSNISEIVNKEILPCHSKKVINGTTFQMIEETPWTLYNEHSRFYFSDSRRAIRSLLRPEHWRQQETIYHIFHSVKDAVVPIKDKDRLAGLLKKSARVCYRRITEEDIDGKIFKNTGHAMKSSLRGLFDLAMEKDPGGMSRETALTDFDLEKQYRFVCGEETYVFRYSKGYKLTVELERTVLPG